MPAKKRSKLGRPPASSSIETRTRILDVARESFAELGFGVTTNKHVATKAGITTGALYHYFDSKSAIYAAVYEQVTEKVFNRFDAAIQGIESFVGCFEAVLEEAHLLNNEDPSLARFLSAARVDVLRHDELRPALHAFSTRSPQFRDDMVQLGVRTGEIAPDDRALANALVQILLVGLTDGPSADNHEHRLSIDAIRSLLEGRLLSPVSKKRLSTAAPAKRSGKVPGGSDSRQTRRRSS